MISELYGKKRNQLLNQIFVQWDWKIILGLCNPSSITKKLGLKI